MKAVAVGGRSILLCRSEDRLFAVDNLCPHAEQPLEGGRIKRCWIACPFHGARFDLETGEPLAGPTEVPLTTFPVRVEDGVISVAV